MDYVDLQRHWRKLGPIYRSDMARAVWFPAMAAYERLRMRNLGVIYPAIQNTPDITPASFDSCDWRWSSGRRGPQPGYWAFTCHAACFFLADLHLWAARRFEPETQWRIVYSDLHAVVWDGGNRVVDGNFQAFGTAPGAAWWHAGDQDSTVVLEPGQLLNYCREEVAA